MIREIRGYILLKESSDEGINHIIVVGDIIGVVLAGGAIGAGT
jgi:hypothetical protein